RTSSIFLEAAISAHIRLPLECPGTATCPRLESRATASSGAGVPAARIRFPLPQHLGRKAAATFRDPGNSLLKQDLGRKAEATFRDPGNSLLKQDLGRKAEATFRDPGNSL